MSGRAARTAVFITALTAGAVFFIDICNMIYRCGCRSWWNGAAAHCNVHQAHAVRRCPLCVIPVAGQLAIFGAAASAQAFISFRATGWGAGKRLVLALAAFPVVMLLIALPLGSATGYWSN